MSTDIPTQAGMKAKTIKAIIRKKIDDWLSSIDDPQFKSLAEKNTIVTGGCIASMLLGEKVNDFDLYFTNLSTAEAAARYYVGKFNERTSNSLKVDVTDGRVRVVTESGHRGETAGDVVTLSDSGQIEDLYEESQEKAQETENDVSAPYRPVFLSTNAITLSSRIQLVLRFYGDADAIHENYDFVHCTNHWTSKANELTLRPGAMEALLTRELRYVGSKYPVCSVIRLRKFISRGWSVNAGQILKMLMQISKLDLTDPAILEDQLTGVDSAYFIQIIQKVKEKDAEKINSAYLVEIIDRMF